MRKVIWLLSSLVLGLALVAGVGIPNVAASKKSAGTRLTTVKVALPVPAVSFLPFYIGQYDGLYKKAGLNVVLQYLPVPVETPALLSTQVQFLGALSVGEQNGMAKDPSQFPLKILEVSTQYALFDVVGAPGITSMKQIVGKVVAGSGGPGGQLTEFLKEALSAHGVSPTQYSMANADTEVGAFSLVKAGKASATAVDVVKIASPELRGYKILATGKGVPSLGAGLVTTEGRMASQKGLVQRMVSATVRATKIAATNEKVAIAALRRGMASTNLGYSTKQWKKAWKGSLYMFTRNGKPLPAAEQAFLDLIKQQTGLPSAPPASQIFNLEFVGK